MKRSPAVRRILTSAQLRRNADISEGPRWREENKGRKDRGPTAKEWEDALNLRSLGSGKAERNADVFHLLGGDDDAVQATEVDQEAEYVVRVGIASLATVELLQAAGVNEWDVSVAIQEGYRGAKYAYPINPSDTDPANRIQVPVKGLALPLHGCGLYVQVFVDAANVDPYDISASITRRALREGRERRTRNSADLVTVPEWATEFFVSVPGGVQVGDSIATFGYALEGRGAYVAAEGREYGVGQKVAFVKYVPAGGAVSNIVWTFKTQR